MTFVAKVPAEAIASFELFIFAISRFQDQGVVYWIWSFLYMGMRKTHPHGVEEGATLWVQPWLR